jgi:hypothetical protein
MRTLPPRPHRALAGVLVAVLAGGVASSRPWQDDPGDRAPTPTFRISGHVVGLYPGKRTTMRVQVRNPYRFPIVVRSVRATVKRASASCRGTNVVVSAFRGSRRIRPRGRIVVRMDVRMPRSAPGACESSKLPIVFTGKAFRA